MGSHSPQSIPTVDVSAFTSSGSLESRQEAARELARCCQPHGCVGVTGHGVPTELLEEAFKTSSRLFDLPLTEKMKAPHPNGTTPHRGYSATGREKAAGKGALDTGDEARKEELMNVSDFKESYEIGSEDNVEQYNIWLPEDVLPGFRHFTTNFFWRLNETSMAILDALIMSVGFSQEDAEYVKRLHTGHNNQLRLLHYPPVPKGVDLSRLGSHADWSSFTLLFQGSQGGLEFANRETGNFMLATPRTDMLYLNIGDMFMRLSNGFYPSATHRVTIPRNSESQHEDAEVTPARYSIPYFVVPDADGIIVPQPSRIIADQKALYEPITFRGFSETMFQAIQTQDK